MNARGKRNPDRPSVFIEAALFAWRWFAGIWRYTTRPALASAAQNVYVRFFQQGKINGDRKDKWAHSILTGLRRRVSYVPLFPRSCRRCWIESPARSP
jgi:hypothetical protein